MISLFLQPLQYLGTQITDDLEFLGRCQIVVGSLFSFLSDRDLKALTASALISPCLPMLSLAIFQHNDESRADI